MKLCNRIGKLIKEAGESVAIVWHKKKKYYAGKAASDIVTAMRPIYGMVEGSGNRSMEFITSISELDKLKAKGYKEVKNLTIELNPR